MTIFGTTLDGRKVEAVTIGAGDLTVTLINWGAVVQDVRLAGVPYSLTQGSDHIADYEGAMRYHGSLIGPVVNRITGGFAVIDGVRHEFEKNLRGLHLIHNGTAGTHTKHWDLRDHSPIHATFGIHLPAGEGGFPGNRDVTARFEVAAPATLRLTVTGTTDAATIMNFANHSYWNLDGTENWSGHHIRVAADRMLPSDDDFKPTGEIRPVAGTEFDFRAGRTIAVGNPLLDNCFCVSDSRQALRDVLWLTGKTGVTMTIATTEPGIHLYDGRHAIRPGHGPHEGLAFEPESWPDATTHAGFPSIALDPGQVYEQVSEWKFGKPTA
jgi:aldose 1-epimerase